MGTGQLNKSVKEDEVDEKYRYTLSTREHIAEHQQHQSRQMGPCLSGHLAPINQRIQLGRQKKRRMQQKARASLCKLRNQCLNTSLQRHNKIDIDLKIRFEHIPVPTTGLLNSCGRTDEEEFCDMEKICSFDYGY